MLVPVRLKGVAGGTLLLSFALLVALLVASAVVAYLNVQSMERDFEILQHSYEVLQITSRTTGDMAALQSAARAYVNSGYEEFESTYREEKKAVGQDLDDLYIETSDN